MLDSIGLGGFLFSFGLLCGATFFVAFFLFSKVLLKKSTLLSSLLGVGFGILGFFASPYIFLVYINAVGYSL